MTEIEVSEILKIAEGYWPKATGHELGLLGRTMKRLFMSDAKNILDETKLEHQYQTFPLEKIAKKVKSHKPRRLGQDITCYALDAKGDWYECVVTAQSNDGAKVQMAKYLVEICYQDPTDFIVFVGQENFDTFFAARHEVLRTLDPQLDEKVAKFKKIIEGRMKDKLVSVLPEFDPNFDDGIPF